MSNDYDILSNHLLTAKLMGANKRELAPHRQKIPAVYAHSERSTKLLIKH